MDLRKNGGIQMKKNNGITLIALIVTIIVLLILAGVSLSLVAGGDGILERAETSTKEYRISAARELLDLKLAEIDMDSYETNLRKATFVEIVNYLKDDPEIIIVKKVADLKDGVTLPEDLSTLKAISVCSVDYTDIIFKISNSDEIEVSLDDENMNEEGSENKPETKTLTYDANGGTGNVPESSSYEEGTEVSVDFSELPTREGYKFLGWATSKDATEAEYTEGATFEMGTSDVMLYAVWAEKVKPNYGTEIQDNYPDLYLSSNPQVSYTSRVADSSAQYASHSGNYAPSRLLVLWEIYNDTKNFNLVNSPEGSSNQAHIYSGTKQYTLKEATATNRWFAVIVRTGYLTKTATISGLKLMFKDSNTYTLNEAFENDYIEPLVICDSANAASTGHWQASNLFSGGDAGSADWATLLVMFKVKDKSQFAGVELYADRQFNQSNSSDGSLNTDGLFVYQAVEGYEVSTASFDV